MWNDRSPYLRCRPTSGDSTCAVLSSDSYGAKIPFPWCIVSLGRISVFCNFLSVLYPVRKAQSAFYTQVHFLYPVRSQSFTLTVFGSQSRVTSNRKTTKPKQTVGILSKNSGKQTTTKKSLPWKLKAVQVLKLPFQFLLKKVKKRFLNSVKLVSVTDIRRKYSWEFRHLKIVTLL